MSDFNISMIRNAAAALAPHVVRTPLLSSPVLDRTLGLRLFVKAENLQTTGSFKLRGALNKVLTLDEAARRRGVIAFSAGNHGQAVAAAAKINGCPATIVLPKSAPQVKVDGCRWWGAQVVFYDPDAEDRRDVVQRIIDAQGWTLVHPFDDPHVMAGQDTVGLEIVQQLTELGVSADAAIVNCSGGGLASGVVTAMRDVNPGLAFYLTEIAGFEKWARSLVSRRPEQSKPVARTVMDGINGPLVGTEPLAVMLSQRDVGTFSVNDEEALRAVRAAFEHFKLVLEPAGAASLAVVHTQREAFRDKAVVVVASGGNVDPSVFRSVLA
jgi:threonine dehydratase